MRQVTVQLEDDYYSITVANHRLITVIRFVAKSYTHLWRGFVNRLHLIFYACEIFSRLACARNTGGKPNKALMNLLTAWLEDGYCSIIVANHQLITVIRFITKNYTHPWRGFANCYCSITVANYGLSRLIRFVSRLVL